MNRAAAVSVALALGSCCPQLAVPPQAVVAPPATAKPTPSPVPPAADLWATSGIDWSQPPAPGPEPTFTPPVPQTFEVAGARVVLVENHRLPLVSVRVVLHRAGSREDGVRSGLAAVTSDLLVEGAGRFDAVSFPEELERLGAQLDVEVADDAATVSLDTLRETLEPSLGLLADVIVRPRLAAKDFARVRGDRLAMLAVRPDQPSSVALLAFEQTVYGAHPYGASGAGYVATVKRITLGDVKAFWRSRYRPNDATIIIAGDVDRATIEAQLAAALAGWRAGKAPALTTPPAPAPRPPVLAVVDRPGAPQSIVAIGRLAPASGDPSYFPAEVINAAVGGSFLSRLNGRLREELGYTYSARSGYYRGRWAGTWGLSAAFKSANTVDGIREALAIVDTARTTDVPAAELDKAILMMTRSAPQEFETNSGIASAFEDLVIQGLPLDWHQTSTASIRAVTNPAIRSAIGEAWRDLTIVVVGDYASLKDGLASFKLPIVQLDADGKPAKR